jgi:hypothetical protein
MHKIFKLVMSIGNKKTTDGSIQDRTDSSLTKQEIELLINMVRTTSFLGEHVESIYNMVIKLQTQYVDIKD